MSRQRKSLRNSRSHYRRISPIPALTISLPPAFVHPKSAVELNLKLFKEQEDCDVFFVVGSNKVRVGAHRIILKGRSPVFKTMFAQRWETFNSKDAGTTTTIPLPDADAGAFNSFLKYIYADLFTSSIVEAMKILQFADMYDVQPLVRLCEQLMAKELKLEDALQVFMTARTYSLTTLMTQAGYLMASNFVELSQLDTFDQADEETLMYLLKREDLHVEEPKLFSILLEWADEQIQRSAKKSRLTRGELLTNILPLVRFPTMSAKEFAEVVAPTSLLSPQTALDLFMYLNSNEESRKAIRSSIPYDLTPRRGAWLVMDLYKNCSRPGTGTFHNSLEIISNGQDTLRFKFSGHSLMPCRRLVTAKLCSLKLQAPKCDVQVFPNYLQQGAIDFPIKVRITLSQVGTDLAKGTATTAERTSIATELKDTMEVDLDPHWELITDQSYNLSVIFQSSVYAAPKQLDSGGSFYGARDEKVDIFSSTKLVSDIVQKYSVGTVKLSDIAMSANSGMMSPGLHVVRSLKIAVG